MINITKNNKIINVTNIISSFLSYNSISFINSFLSYNSISSINFINSIGIKYFYKLPRYFLKNSFLTSVLGYEYIYFFTGVRNMLLKISC